LVNILDAKHQSISAFLYALRHEGIVYVSERRTNKNNIIVNAYRLVVDLAAAKVIDVKCGRENAPTDTRTAVVAYLAACSEEEWDSILHEAAALAG
jgi:hypothetical protein